MLDIWSGVYENRHAQGAYNSGKVASVDDCKLKCEGLDNCVGLDINPTKLSCWIHTDCDIVKYVYFKNNVNHIQLVDKCYKCK